MLHIGCTQEERAVAQPIRLKLAVGSREKFPACSTDELEDTLDAAELQSVLMKSAADAHVRTLERLGEILEAAFRKKASRLGLEWEVTIAKPSFGWSYVHSWSS